MAGRGPVRLVLVRHAETTWNVEGRWQGQSGAGLSPTGHRQALATAHHLADRFPDAALIACSDSQRVTETAAPLVELLAAPVVVDPRLREVDVGAWSGLTRPEVEEVDPEGWAAYRRGDACRIGGGETVAEVRQRACEAVDDLLRRVRRRGTAIVLTHGWTLRILVAALVGMEAERLPRAPNCSLAVLDVWPARVERVAYGECGHLEEGAQHGAGMRMSQRGSEVGP